MYKTNVLYLSTVNVDQYMCKSFVRISRRNKHDVIWPLAVTIHEYVSYNENNDTCACIKGEK